MIGKLEKLPKKFLIHNNILDTENDVFIFLSSFRVKDYCEDM